MKKGKEKLEDINVMNGIDFKTNRRREIERQMIKEINRKKELKAEIIVSGAILIIIGIFIICYHVTNKGVENCAKHYNYNYCIAKL